ncbi:polysaccharide deacetylase family protein [Niallia oryzisoli]|uniref:polysaccharide deacetylase family protein n=1 Tax=Niallia oryzisoli TaxID=1737571 RepID=UPI0037366800
MPRRRRLNSRGKIAVTVLLTIMVVLLSGLFGKDEKKAENENDTNRKDMFEMISFSTEPVAAFANSTLSQSIIEKENKKIEAARKIEVAKQMKLDQLEKAIFLTFDDGPTNVTQELLDILEDYQMRATFFMIGPNIKEYPEVVKRMQKDGFALGLHGITHDVKKIYSNESAPTKEMIENQGILEDVTGIRTELIRLPYGSFPYLSEAMRYVLDQNNFKVWDWNVDSFDWKYRNEQYVQQTISGIQSMEQSGVSPVVLLHDTNETIKYLPKLLSYIKEQGYETKILTNDMPPLTFSCEGQCSSVK